jgi:molecular chaperone DnaK
MQLGIAVFEIGDARRGAAGGSGGAGGGPRVELVFDPTGAARVTALTPEQEDERTHFWLNEHSPTFLDADPPGRQGEPRFEVHFGVDANKRLLITARDVATGRVTHRDYPVVKLT